VIFEHLYELSDGKLDLRQVQKSYNTTDLLRTNKRISNKILQWAIKFKVTKTTKTGKVRRLQNNNNNQK
jgi:hypothetical protein